MPQHLDAKNTMQPEKVDRQYFIRQHFTNCLLLFCHCCVNRSAAVFTFITTEANNSKLSAATENQVIETTVTLQN